MEEQQLSGSRARFLGAAGITGAALATGAWKTASVGAASPRRSYSGGRFALSIDGENGYVESAEGGNPVGEVVVERGSADYYQRKHIGNVKYEDCTVEIGSSIGQSFKDWIKASLDGKHVRKSGAIIAADFDYAERSRREFREALITEVGFPALDAASKETAFLTVTFAPELIERKAGSGQKLPAEKTKQKAWLRSNFRFEIKGLPTSKVNKIDAFTIKQTMVTDGIGESRDQQKEPGKLEFPNLAFTLAESDAQPWYDWFDDFVLRGNNGPDKEKTGVLEFVDPSRTDVLLAVEFRGLGIFKVASDTSEAGEQAIRRIKVELYCESLTVAFTGGSG